MKAVPCADARQARHDLPGLEVGDHPVQRNVRQAVRIVGEEDALSLEVPAHPEQPLRDVRVQAGVDEGDAPVLDVGGHEARSCGLPPHREVVREALLVVQEVLPDEVAAVSETQHEILVAVVRVVPHQVPEDRPVADVHQRLRDAVRVLAKAHAQTPAEKDDFHDIALRTTPGVRLGRPAPRGGSTHADPMVTGQASEFHGKLPGIWSHEKDVRPLLRADRTRWCAAALPRDSLSAPSRSNADLVDPRSAGRLQRPIRQRADRWGDGRNRRQIVATRSEVVIIEPEPRSTVRPTASSASAARRESLGDILHVDPVRQRPLVICGASPLNRQRIA